jgi:hypothetical protein
VIGWRLMQLHADGTIRSDWLPREALDAAGVFTARCEHGHAPPVADCSCGVYVTEDPTPLLEWISTNPRRLYEWLVVCEGHLDGPVLDDPSMPVWPPTNVRCLRGSRFTVTRIHADPRAHHADRAARRYGLPLQPLDLLETA